MNALLEQTSLEQRFHTEFQALLPYIETLRVAADALDEATPQNAAIAIRAAVGFLPSNILPRADFEKTELYPAIGRIQGAPTALAALQREHTEIALMTDELAQAERRIGASPLSRRQLNALRLLLYGLYTLLLEHFAGEEQVYRFTLERHAAPEATTDGRRPDRAQQKPALISAGRN